MNETFDIMYAQRLAENDKKIRDKALSKVSKYIGYNPSGLEESNYMKLWKGFYYSLYMADKPLIQEEVAEKISLLIHSCTSFGQKLLFFKCSLNTFAREWEGIDNFRINKFMMLVTRVLRQMLVCLKNGSWKIKEVNDTVSMLETIVIVPEDNANKTPLGLKFHVASTIMDELAKIGREDLPHRVIITFIYPYIKVLMLSNIPKYVYQVKRYVIYWLIDQSEAVQGSEEEEIEDEDTSDLKEEPDSEIDQEMDDSDEGVDESESQDNDGIEEEIVLDPRAGGVDVVLPQLQPDYDKIADLLFSMGSIPTLKGKRRKEIYRIVQDFKSCSQGENPFEDDNCGSKNKTKALKRKTFNQLKEFEENIMADKKLGRSFNKQKYQKKHSDVLKPNKKRNFEEMMEDDSSEDYRKSFKKRRKEKKIKNGSKMPMKKVASQTQEESPLSSEVIDVKLKEIAGKVGFPLKNNQKKLKSNIKKGGKPEAVSVPKKKKKRTGPLKVTAESVAKLELKEDCENSLNKQEHQEKPSGAKKRKRRKGAKKAGNSASEEPAKKLSEKAKNANIGEFEIVIQPKKKKKVALQPADSSDKLQAESTPNSRGKILKINLEQNMEHDFQDYRKVINENPSIPFSSLKKPKESVLKSKGGSLQKPVKSPTTRKPSKKLVPRKKVYVNAKKKGIRRNFKQ